MSYDSSSSDGFITLPCGRTILRESAITPTTPCGDSSLEKGTPTPQVAVGQRWEKGFANGVKGRIINFTPSWFAVNMGTGIVSIILHNLPYQFTGLRTIATIVFGLNVVLFILFTLITIARYLIWPKIFSLMIHHNVQSLFWGSFSMGNATVVTGVVLFLVPLGGNWLTFAWTIWWIQVFISVLVGVGIPFMMFTRHKNESVGVVTGVWILPVVSPIVAAASGAIIANVLPASDARLTIIVSYFLLGMGLAPAVLIQALYFQRLAIFKLPPSSVIISVYLPIGCNGQSAFVLVQLAVALRRLQSLDGNGLGGILSVAENETIVLAIYALSLISAFFLMGLGFFWLIIAVATTLDLVAQGGFPFNAGWWGLTFPIGTMATAAIILAAELDSTAFRVLAMMLSVSVVIFWLFVSVRTTIQAISGKAFIAPCLGATGRAPA